MAQRKYGYHKSENRQLNAIIHHEHEWDAAKEEGLVQCACGATAQRRADGEIFDVIEATRKKVSGYNGKYRHI